MTTIPGVPATNLKPLRSPRRHVIARLLRNPVAATCITLLVIITIAGLLAPTFPVVGPNVSDLLAVNAAPFSPGHLLGADGNGRDIFSRLLWGTSQTLLGCLIILAVALALGVPTGLVAGFYRGRFEAVSNWVSDALLSLPGIILLIALYTFTGPNILIAMAVFGIILAPGYFRLVRAAVLGVRSELFVDAAKVVGLSDFSIVGRHILWAARGPVIVQSAFIAAAGIGIQAGVNLIGLGDPTQPSWGGVLENSFNNIYNNGVAVLWPSLIISLATLLLVLLGTALRDALQGRSRVKAWSAKRKRRALEDASGQQTASDSNAALVIQNLRIGYPQADGSMTEVVHGIDLTVERGEIRGLVGESGSGKSQTAFAVLGILPREAVILGGSIRIDGVDVLRDGEAMKRLRGRGVAYIPQEPMSNLDPSMQIGAQLKQGLRAARRMSRADSEEYLLDLMDRVGIKDSKRVFRMYPHEISGGMAQRVLICGAVASNPNIIIADEPTTALDVTVQADVLELLRGLRDERGLAMILVTHNLGVVADLCDTVSVMRDGLIIEQQDVNTLFDSPTESYTQELIASSRSVEVKVVEN